MSRLFRVVVLATNLACFSAVSVFAGVPGTARTFSLANKTIEAVWEVAGGRFRVVSVTDRWNKRKLALPESAFALTFRGGQVLKSSEMALVSGPRVEKLEAKPNASRLAERLNGRQITVDLESTDGKIRVNWRGILRADSNYIRQEITVQALQVDLEISDLRLLDLTAPGAQVVGTVKGSPVVAGPMFFGFEHPLSTSTVENDNVRCSVKRALPLRVGKSITYSSVIGTTRPGQLRRDFLRYVERERAHPYRTFLHYNSWYDLGYFSKFDEQGALGVIETFGKELREKRGVTLDSFLFDDGWDDPATLWRFHTGFPNGFTPLKEAAARYGAGPGVWLSPWGGYGKPKQERLKFGKEQGFETNGGGFALSGPKYYQRFRETCLNMIRSYGVNQFKVDGTGNVNSAIQGSEFDSDFSAAISLIESLRLEKPDLYVNLTTGTYPSPFWLQYADSIWRGGEDHEFAGVGSFRQRWITYRDADTYKGIVQKGRLFPLNSLMLHGLIFARSAKNLDADPNDDFDDEIRSYFGTGTQLQEMYVTPSLLKAKDWDLIAEAARWSRANAGTLVDTHWVGGDPSKLEVYGWASWSPRKGILTFRNPSDKPQRITLDLREIFELPRGAAQTYVALSPWQADGNQPAIRLRAGEKHTFDLRPFQVITLEADPRK